MKEWKNLIFSDDTSFDEKARLIFKYQYKNNIVYHRYCQTLGVSPGDYQYEWEKTLPPMLSVRAFKDATVTSVTEKEADLIFQSSGTGGMQKSIHRVVDAGIYRTSILEGFKAFYNLDKATFLGYTPGYVDNPHSSLIWMINELIGQDSSGCSRFLPLDEPLDQDEVDRIADAGRQMFLFGAAFGLLDLCEVSDVKLPDNSIVLETGGMKTHKREMNRDRLHKKLSSGFDLPVRQVHSEYGMAELLSQSYATGGPWFWTPSWMKVIICNPDDLQEPLPPHTEGKIGVIDLANVHSCSFLVTEDRGVLSRDGKFRVLGRWNPKDLRGCNFLIDED